MNGQAPKATRNGQITAGYEALVENAGRVLLVGALHELGELRKQAEVVSRKQSASRRRVAARRAARRYVPRGPERREFMAALIERVADRYSQMRREPEQPSLKVMRLRADFALLGAAAYAVYPDAPQSGDRARRARDSYFERLHSGARMVARRGAGRCINLDCDQRSGSVDYCEHCSEDADVQRDHTKRRKTIDELWTSVLGARTHFDRRLLAIELAPDAGPSPPRARHSRASLPPIPSGPERCPAAQTPENTGDCPRPRPSS